MARLTGRLGIGPGETTADGAYTVEPVRCLGLCDRAPAALVNLDRHAPAGAETLLDGQPAPGPYGSAGWSRSRWPTSAWWTPPASTITAPRAAWPR